MRAFRFEVLNEPKPGQATLSPFIADETTRSKNSAIVRSASALDTPAFCDTASINSAVSQKAGVSKADAERTIAEFFDLVVSSAMKGDKVAWPGFGSFSTSKRKARIGRNPQTGAPVQVKASTAMKFSSSSTLKAALNPNR